ncbi:MAG: hypothetical protein ACXWTX_06655 [Gallionella sp.]
MLQTIEVEIDPSGYIHPLEPLTFVPSGRAYLTLLPTTEKELPAPIAGDGSAANALELLATPRFAQRPPALADEVQQRINELRNDWGDH